MKVTAAMKVIAAIKMRCDEYNRGDEGHITTKVIVAMKVTL